MISFVDLVLHPDPEPGLERHDGLRPLIIGLVLCLILCFQVGLVLWISLSH